MSVPDPALHDWVPIYAPGPTPISYGTSLPTNPIDGQEAILVDSITNPSYQWRFRYNAQSTSPYKWEFVGGSPSHISFPTSQPQAAGWAIASDPRFDAPRPGEYLCSFSSLHLTSAAIGIGVSLYLDGVNQGHTQVLINSAAAWYQTLVQTGIVLTVPTAGQRIVHGYHLSSGSSNVMNRFLNVQPRRVS